MFLTLKNKFLGMIDYRDETLQSVTVGQKENITRKKRHSARSTVPFRAKNQIAHEMDVLTDAVEWIEKKRWRPQQLQNVWVTPEKLEMGQIEHSRGGRSAFVLAVRKRNPLVWAGLGWGVYSNKRQIDKIKDNIRKLQDQNILQEKANK